MTINERTVSGRSKVTVRVPLAAALALVLKELAEAEHRTPDEQAAYLLEGQLQRLLPETRLHAAVQRIAAQRRGPLPAELYPGADADMEAEPMVAEPEVA